MGLNEFISLLLAAILGGIWIYQYFILGCVVSQRQRLGANTYDGPPNPAPKVSVLVAAKDEEANIEACITSLLDQDYPNFEIVAIDDRSEDATPDILLKIQNSELGIQNSLRVLTVTTLPEGWMGKSHAMHQGVRHCTGDWLLFTDADCRFTAKNAISIAMRDSIETDTEFLSITPFLETLTVWERIIQPVCALVLMLFFVPQKVNDPARKTAYANGAFMLLLRSCYDAIGGHKRVQGQLNEDIQLARIAKRMAVRLRVAETDDLYRTRMYDSIGAAWSGWSRILYGSLQSMERLVVSASAVTFLSIGPWVGLTIATIAYRGPHSDGLSTAVIIAWLVVVFFEQAFLWRVYRLVSVNPLWSLTHVLGAFVGLGIILSAMRQLRGSAPTTWRGTTYRKNDNAEGVTVKSSPAAPFAKPAPTKQANA